MQFQGIPVKNESHIRRLRNVLYIGKLVFSIKLAQILVERVYIGKLVFSIKLAQILVERDHKPGAGHFRIDQMHHFKNWSP